MGHGSVATKRKQNKTASKRVADDLFGPEETKKHSVLWWIFITPGKVILWFEYMFPHRVGGVFGSARRRKSPIIEISYRITFYIFFVIALIFLIMKFA